jgi:hypothetical protein
MSETAARLRALIEAELVDLGDARDAAHVCSLLVEPVAVLRHWDCSEDHEQYAWWGALEHLSHQRHRDNLPARAMHASVSNGGSACRSGGSQTNRTPERALTERRSRGRAWARGRAPTVWMCGL